MASSVLSKRALTGAGIGAGVGFLFGGPLGAGLGALLGGAVGKSSETAAAPSEMTARQRLIFARAMESVQDPADLRKLAGAFHGEGFALEADALEKRARLRELPRETKEQRRGYFRKAMASDDSAVIREVAQAFQGEGALDAAKALFDHADAVDAAHLAGKSCRPMAGGSQAQFADRLAKAILHFGPNSAQAKSASANLVRARGKQPTDMLVDQTIRVAVQALDVKAPPAGAPPEQPIEVAVPGESEGAPAEGAQVDEAPVDGAEAAPAEQVEQVVPAATSCPDGEGNPPEPTVLGPPAPVVDPPAEVVAAAEEAAPIAESEPEPPTVATTEGSIAP